MGEGTHIVTFSVAVIPTRGRESLQDAIKSIEDQVDAIVVVYNNLLDPDLIIPRFSGKEINTKYDLDPPNISRFWNKGIYMARLIADQAIEDKWNTVIINDDVVVPENFVATLDLEMRKTTAVLAYPDQFGTVKSPCLHQTANPIDIRHRITGYAFMLRAEVRIKLDPTFGWWYGDDDLDWRCRERGGSLLVPGCAVDHKFPNGYTVSDPRLTAQAGKDRENFQNKWGRTPH